jgi:hypothetical protein
MPVLAIAGVLTLAAVMVTLVRFTLKPSAGSAAARRVPSAPTAVRATNAAAHSSPTAANANLTLRAILDERFGSNQRQWLNAPASTAWLAADGTYHLLGRQPGRFVAVGAPGVSVLRDVVVTATIHKVGGPAGGGYGVFVRDQGLGPRDGLNQAGRFYLFEVGDQGEVGSWRRENDHWVEIQPWTTSAAVRPDAAPNQLEVVALGSQLIFRVNGTQVLSQVDATLSDGMVGLFVGGDGNEAVVDP